MAERAKSCLRGLWCVVIVAKEKLWRGWILTNSAVAELVSIRLGNKVEKGWFKIIKLIVQTRRCCILSGYRIWTGWVLLGRGSIGVTEDEYADKIFAKIDFSVELSIRPAY
jgi:hypothetical protein